MRFTLVLAESRQRYNYACNNRGKNIYLIFTGKTKCSACVWADMKRQKTLIETEEKGYIRRS